MSEHKTAVSKGEKQLQQISKDALTFANNLPLHSQITLRILPFNSRSFGILSVQGGDSIFVFDFWTDFSNPLELDFFFCLVAFGTNFARCDTLSNIRSLLD